MREQLAQLADPVPPPRRRLVRVDPERRVDAVVLLGDRERGAARPIPVPIVIDSRHPRLARAVDAPRPVLERVEVRVRVDHASAARLHPRELVGDDLLGIELAEQRVWLSQRLPGLERARLPARRPSSCSRP